MSYHECERCWQITCECGHQYKEFSIERIDSLIQILTKIKESKKNEIDKKKKDKEEKERVKKLFGRHGPKIGI